MAPKTEPEGLLPTNLMNTEEIPLVDHHPVVEHQPLADPVMGTSKLVHLAEEFDERMRQCILYRYCRPVQNAWLSQTFGARNDPSTIPIHLQHWALVAYFPQGNRFLLFEANENTQTRLMEATVSHLLWTREGVSKEELSTVFTSPKRLLELSQGHPHNNSLYSITLNNCQEWFKTFYQLILNETSSQHDNSDERIVTYLDETMRATGRVGGVLVASFFDLVKRVTGGLGSASVRTIPGSNSISGPPRFHQ